VGDGPRGRAQVTRRRGRAPGTALAPPEGATGRGFALRLLPCLLLTAAVAACGGGSRPPPAAEPAAAIVATRTELGVNLPPVSDWSATPVYVDLVRQARRFGTPAKPWDEAAVLGPDGWPVGDFGVFLMTGQSRVSGTAGTYKVSFRGQATVGVVASTAGIANQAYDPAADRTTLDVVVPEGTDQLALGFTQTRGGIKDLAVIRPGYDPDDAPLFTRPFLDHIARFGTLRFMDWLATNVDSGSGAWAARPTPATVRYAAKAGVPWEHVIALANQAGKDVWINVPVRADDDYVRELARLLKATLRPELRVYVEYSNELWNGLFPQFALNVAMAKAEVQADPRSVLAYDRATDANTLAFRRVALRLKQIGDIFRAEYGDAAMLRTIRPVLSGQVVQPYVTEIGLAFIDAVYGPPARYFHAIAGAPYFNLGPLQTAEGLTPDQVLQAMEGSLASLAAVNAFERNRGLASWYGLRWLAYEGGADTFGPGSIAAKAAAGMDPRLEGLCLRYLQTWNEAGGDLFVWYTAGAGQWTSPYGTFELTVDLAVTDAPKLRCLEKAIAGQPATTRGRNAAPGAFAATAHLGNSPSPGEPTVRYLQPGRYVDYLVHADRAATFALTLTTEAGAPGNSVDIAVNGTPVANDVPLTVTGWGTPAAQPPIPVSLDRGFNTLRLTTHAATTGYALHRLELR
jgi:hypothetical protein